MELLGILVLLAILWVAYHVGRITLRVLGCLISILLGLMILGLLLG